jgi:hypothetical protein
MLLKMIGARVQDTDSMKIETNNEKLSVCVLDLSVSGFMLKKGQLHTLA